MLVDPQATGVRLPAEAPGWRWSAWLALRREKRRRLREEQLVLIEALDREKRLERRAGEYIPDLSSTRRWQ